MKSPRTWCQTVKSTHLQHYTCQCIVKLFDQILRNLKTQSGACSFAGAIEHTQARRQRFATSSSTVAGGRCGLLGFHQHRSRALFSSGTNRQPDTLGAHIDPIPLDSLARVSLRATDVRYCPLDFEAYHSLCVWAVSKKIVLPHVDLSAALFWQSF